MEWLCFMLGGVNPYRPCGAAILDALFLCKVCVGALALPLALCA